MGEMNQLNGLLLVDKPSGCTSHDVVARVRRILGMRGVGHAGTLDPLASGLLVLLLGEGTKISDYVLNGDKGYEVTIQLGVRTDSFDRTGVVVETQAVLNSPEQIQAAILSLSGRLELAVPRHSAVKVDGRKLYEYARREQEVEVPVRTMEFWDLNILEVRLPFVKVGMRCSKGSYVRAWVERLGKDLGCGAQVEELRRTFSAPYTVEQSLTLEALESAWKDREIRSGAVLGEAWIPLKDTLPNFKTLRIDGFDEVLMRNGQISKNLQAQLLGFISARGTGVLNSQAPPQGANRTGSCGPGVKVVSRATNDLISLLASEEGQFYRIRRVFHGA